MNHLGHHLEHFFINTNGVDLHVVESGPADGPPVFLLHGFPEFWYGWRNQIEFLANSGYRVVVPDQRGYNLSGKPDKIASYNIDELAQDIIGLMDALGYGNVSLIGHDWGGMVGWWVAIKNSDRLRKIVLLNIPHPQVMKQTLKRSWRQRFRSWYILLFQVPWLPEFLLSRQNFGLISQGLIRSSCPGTFSDEDLRKYREAWSQKNSLRSMLNWYRAALRASPEKYMDQLIDVAILLIWGKRDSALGSEMAAPSKKLCRVGKLVFFERATHWVQHEERAKVNSLIIDFLRS